MCTIFFGPLDSNVKISCKGFVPFLFLFLFSSFLPVLVVRVHFFSSPITQVHFVLLPRWSSDVPVSNGKNYSMHAVNTKNCLIMEYEAYFPVH